MTEFGEPLLDNESIDPRTELADVLRDFGLTAIKQQAVIDADMGRKSAGQLYKFEAGYLKVHLQAPAEDQTFFNEQLSKLPLKTLPLVWILFPIKNAGEGTNLEGLVGEAESITVHVAVPGHDPLQFLVRDDYHGPLTPLFETAEELLEFEEPQEVEQMVTAKYWAKLLENEYAIRTIANTQAQEPDVA